MLSRVADALYWMARYSERTQTNAHILQVQLLNMLEQSGQEHDYIDHWEAVLNICASKEEYLANYTTIRVNPLIDYLLFSEKNGNALHATLRAIRENARVTRDSMPTELWEIQNSFYLTKQQSILKRERPIPLIALQDFLQDVRKTLWMETGLIEGSMDRDLPFYFMQVGKWLERAEKTIRMIVIIVEQQKRTGTSLLEDDGTFLLDLSAARESFMRKHRQTNLLTVIRYLVQDAHFPCSVMFCVKKIEEAITAIEHDSLSPRFLTLQSDISSLVLAIDHIDFWQMTIEETLKMMEERLSQCMAFSDAFSTIYHYMNPAYNLERNSPQLPFNRQVSKQKEADTMKFEIQHTNIFQYESEVDQSLNTIRLKPRSDERQRLLSYRIAITPSSLTREHTDIWGNTVGSFYIPEQHQILEIHTSSIVSIQRAPFIHRIQYSPEMQTIFHSQLFYEHYLPYLKATHFTFMTEQQLEEVYHAIGHAENPVLFSLNLMQYLYSSFEYDPTATNVTTIASEAFALKRGVCQDFTHVMLAVLRAKGIPARYVSGYLYVDENSALIGDIATHAWVEVMIPGIGWIGLDPTNNVEVLENHIILCIGRDYSDISPVEGVYTGGKHDLTVKVNVKALNHL